MKIAVVSPGVPMEIALNKESKRKTAAVVALRNGERHFGSDAVSLGVRYPQSCYSFLLDLLGKRVEHPQVQLFMARFPHYQIQAHPERGTVMFQHDENTVYTVEELIGMILEHAKSIAETYTEQKIKDAVVTVPVYFNQAERRALLEAASLAQIQVLQLISEPMAVALNYGMFRRKEINGTARNLMFYDMGSQDTTVSIVSFQVIKTKERGFTETHPQAQILGIGYDRNLGGKSVQIKLRDHLADKFNELKKTKTDVRTVPRAMAKLAKEAERVKTVLSANSQIYAQVENVMEDIDFRVEVTRDTLESLNADFFLHVTEPIDMSLKTAAMTMSEIDEIILVGAGTRVPKVQEKLQTYFGRELGRNLNTDEAAAMGAVYRAADLSTGFKVKKFITKDGVLFPIDVDFEREYENDEGEKGVKQVKRTLFSKMNPYPQKKIMTFNKHTGDFTFFANLNELDHISKEEMARIGSLNLTEVKVKGLAPILEKYAQQSNVESKGVKAHFNLDDSGLLGVSTVEAVFEQTITVEEQEAQEKKEEADQPEEAKETEKDDSWSNLGDTISNFFNKDGDDKDKKDGADGAQKEGDKDKKKDKEDKKKKEKAAKKPKIETIKEPLEFVTKIVDLTPMSEELITESMAKLKALNDVDELKTAKETALNSLETFVIDVRDKLYQELWEKSSTEEEREKFSAKCSEISDWIDEEVSPDTELEPLETRLKELKDLTSSWFARVREHVDRPEALGALNQMMNTSHNFLGKAKNKTGEDGFFTEKELETLEKKIQDITKWRDDKLADQDLQPMSEMPKMTASSIAEKALELDREVKYLINKAKIAQAEKEREKRLKEAEEKKAKEEAEKKKKKKDKKKKKAKKDDATSATEDTEEDSKGEEQPEETNDDETEENSTTDETPLNEEVENQPDGKTPDNDNEQIIVEEEGEEDSLSQDGAAEVPVEEENTGHSEL
ncbi:hypoxia up-regulated protein 1-like isoform X2 [Tigriopus californicus]|uniref:hypoxia up-regulated protein 1-like isoform X2 n=1 Tax=Tigriopus californicus TaxID=6832 RepID=UPI0027DAAB45|nr:hypoxia up-regulated protein 1-like isoform X2 [Tigriopus californicus]